MTFASAIEGGAEAGGEGGGIIGAFFGPEGIPVGAALGAVGGGLAAGAGYLWLSSHMSNANDQSKSKSDANTTTDSCSTCKPRDPCQGLRDQIAKHQQKLADYTANPAAHDNKGFLGQGRDDQIISARIASLQKQIDNFKKQLEECEKQNAGS